MTSWVSVSLGIVASIGVPRRGNRSASTAHSPASCPVGAMGAPLAAEAIHIVSKQCFGCGGSPVLSGAAFRAILRLPAADIGGIQHGVSQGGEFLPEVPTPPYSACTCLPTAVA